jgi:hypothetical protein
MTSWQRAHRLAVIFSVAVVAACGPSLIRGPHIAKEAEIDDTPTNRELLQVLEQYRQAMEQRDLKGLLALATRNYYEDAGTAATDDDYGYEGLEKILKEKLSKLKMLRLHIVVDRITVENETRAKVDYTYFGRFQIQGAKRAVWAQKSWEARLRLQREGGRWLIVSGM